MRIRPFSNRQTKRRPSYLRRRTIAFESLEQRLQFDGADSFGPDLVITNYTADSRVLIGGEISASWTVENQGLVTGNQNWRDGLYVSRDEVFDSSDVRVAV